MANHHVHVQAQWDHTRPLQGDTDLYVLVNIMYTIIKDTYTAKITAIVMVTPIILKLLLCIWCIYTVYCPGAYSNH